MKWNALIVISLIVIIFVVFGVTSFSAHSDYNFKNVGWTLLDFNPALQATFGLFNTIAEPAATWLQAENFLTLREHKLYVAVYMDTETETEYTNYAYIILWGLGENDTSQFIMPSHAFQIYGYIDYESPGNMTSIFNSYDGTLPLYRIAPYRNSIGYSEFFGSALVKNYMNDESVPPSFTTYTLDEDNYHLKEYKVYNEEDFRGMIVEFP